MSTRPVSALDFSTDRPFRAFVVAPDGTVTNIGEGGLATVPLFLAFCDEDRRIRAFRDLQTDLATALEDLPRAIGPCSATSNHA